MACPDGLQPCLTKIRQSITTAKFTRYPGYTAIIVCIYTNEPFFSWLLYCQANSVFVTTVLAEFSSLFFNQFQSTKNTVTKSTFQPELGKAQDG